MFVRINGKANYLWAGVDHEGGMLEVFATKRRDHKAVLEFLIRTMKRYGQLALIVTDRLHSCGAAIKVIGNVSRRETGHRLNNLERFRG